MKDAWYAGLYRNAIENYDKIRSPQSVSIPCPADAKRVDRAPGARELKRRMTTELVHGGFAPNPR